MAFGIPNNIEINVNVGFNKPDIQGIKDHIERNKKRYICAGAIAGTLVFALITHRIVRRSVIQRTCIRPMSGADVYTTKPQIDTSSAFCKTINYTGDGNRIYIF